MKLRHTISFAFVGAVLGVLVPFCYWALSKLGVMQASDWLLRVSWPSFSMLLALDLCCGQHAPTSEVVKVTAESIAMNVILYSALMLGIGSCMGKFREIRASRSATLMRRT
jgi:hypothetical protein